MIVFLLKPSEINDAQFLLFGGIKPSSYPLFHIKLNLNFSDKLHYNPVF